MKLKSYTNSYFRYILYSISSISLLLLLSRGNATAHNYNLVETIKKVKPSIIAISTYHPQCYNASHTNHVLGFCPENFKSNFYLG